MICKNFSGADGCGDIWKDFVPVCLGRQPSMTAFFIPLPVYATLKDTLMSKNNVATLKDTKILN